MCDAVSIETMKKVAGYLLQIKAIKLSPSIPFVWASDLKSPVYCDNRKTLSFPEVRSFIRDCFVDAVQNHFQQTQLIAGVATGAIAQGAILADALNLPFVYVRSSAKEHGLENLIEGDYQKGQKVVVIEDLISTGGSSLKAALELKKAGCKVQGLIAIFTYGFDSAHQKFIDAGIPLYTLTNYNVMLDMARESGYVRNHEMEALKKWRISPENWQAQI